MRFHVPALPGRPVTRENSSCAYTQKVRRFCRMMRDRGHEVVLYADRHSHGTGASEYVACYPDSEPLDFEPPLWQEANLSAAAAIASRKEPGDFLCIIGGQAQRAVADAHPDLMAVEYGVGYGGVFADFRVFESYAWMHTVYGSLYGTHAADGRFYDAVIPNYFEVEDFPVREWPRPDNVDLGHQPTGGCPTGPCGDATCPECRIDKGDYLLYVGRMIERKGVGIAIEVAKRLGTRLLLAGPSEHDPMHWFRESGEWAIYLGEVGPERRGELMAGARALLAPTTYVEPFGGVAVEAMLCGTPAITTDWGAFTETVEHGLTGFRCRTLGEFIWAAENATLLDSAEIREYAVSNYSLEAVGPRYEAYFEQLQGLAGDGWYDAEKRSPLLRYGRLVPAAAGKLT